MVLPTPTRTNEEDVLVLAQEVEAEQRLDLTPIDLDGRAPVKAVEHDAVFKASVLQVAFECLVVTPLDIIGQQQRQERRVIELLGTCQHQALRQRWHQLTELQAFEQTDQIHIQAAVHAGTSTDVVAPGRL
jgi:hypothetical protein